MSEQQHLIRRPHGFRARDTLNITYGTLGLAVDPCCCSIYAFLCSAVLRDFSNAKEPYMAVLRGQVIPDGKTFPTSDFKMLVVKYIPYGLDYLIQFGTL
ncbi:hypothetical protein CDAR_559381 [Caerostris darwini]|uniref:Uncharacterized protein n=1 Tax=Caerostris darwini TaxID=1538125 RepID=A0AAV4NZ30_9ARAC|nr:hypothetical protein CDAR_559381 [Caerostris darwini]